MCRNAPGLSDRLEKLILSFSMLKIHETGENRCVTRNIAKRDKFWKIIIVFSVRKKYPYYSYAGVMKINLDKNPDHLPRVLFVFISKLKCLKNWKSCILLCKNKKVNTLFPFKGQTKIFSQIVMKHWDLLLDKKEPMVCANKHGSQSELWSWLNLHNKAKNDRKADFWGL